MLRFLRLKQIIGDPRRDIPPIIPISSSSWWEGVKSGKYPQPVKIGERSSAWPDYEVDAIIAAIIRGESEEQIKELVKNLVESRKTLGIPEEKDKLRAAK